MAQVGQIFINEKTSHYEGRYIKSIMTYTTSLFTDMYIQVIQMFKNFAL